MNDDSYVTVDVTNGKIEVIGGLTIPCKSVRQRWLLDNWVDGPSQATLTRYIRVLTSQAQIYEFKSRSVRAKLTPFMVRMLARMWELSRQDETIEEIIPVLKKEFIG